MKKWVKKIPPWSAGVLLGGLCLLMGFYKEQFTEIYRKAIMICLECIGIG